MRNQLTIQLIIYLALFGLSACNSGGGSGGGGGGGGGSTNTQLSAIASQGANDESKNIDDAVMLKSDINSLFNGTEPVAIEAGETALDVINRLGGGS